MLKVFYILLISLSTLSNNLSFKESLRISFEKSDFIGLINESETIDPKDNKDGYITYLRGSAFLELNQFSLAKEHLLDALTKKNLEKDLFYKLGQCTFALEQFKESRAYFKKSVKRGFNRAISLYYIGFASTKLKDYKTAVRIYSAIEKLPHEEKKEVVQAARLQIAEIYLEKVKKRDNTFDALKTYVLPQYKKALEYDQKSNLALEIRNKIRDIEQKYEIVLYKMRNGRRTSIPRFFLKGGVFSGYDSNVNNLSDSNLKSLDRNDISAPFSGTSFFGRYSFYPNSKFSFSPEASISYKNYISSVDAINTNDEFSIRLGSFITYEHFLFKKAATTSLRFDYSLNASDFDTDSSYSQHDNYFTLTLSEEFQLYSNNPTIIRYVNSSLLSEFETLSFSSNSFVVEQMLKTKTLVYYFFFSYDLLRFVESENQNFNRITLRSDFIFNSFYNIVNIAPYISYTSSKFINTSDNIATNLVTVGMNLNRPIARKVYLNTDMAYEKQSHDKTTNYSAFRLLVSVDYIY